MDKIKCGIIGTVYVSDFHIDAIRRIGFSEILALTDINYEPGKSKAKKYSVPKCCKTLEELLSDDKITKVCADMSTMYNVRKKSKGQVGTFSVSKDTPYENISVVLKL